MPAKPLFDDSLSADPVGPGQRRRTVFTIITLFVEMLLGAHSDATSDLLSSILMFFGHFITIVLTITGLYSSCSRSPLFSVSEPKLVMSAVKPVLAVVPIQLVMTIAFTAVKLALTDRAAPVFVTLLVIRKLFTFVFVYVTLKWLVNFPTQLSGDLEKYIKEKNT